MIRSRAKWLHFTGVSTSMVSVIAPLDDSIIEFAAAAPISAVML
jgi:hypothetical protein